MRGLEQVRRAYSTDISDTTWQRIEPLIPAARSNTVVGGRARSTNMRDVVDALVYRERVQCPWRLLPHDFPHWQIVRHYYATWVRQGRWQRISNIISHSPSSGIRLG